LTARGFLCMVCVAMWLSSRCLLLPLLFALSIPPLAVSAADSTTRPPVPFRLSRPPYPEALLPYRIRGEVRLAFDVDTYGYVSNIEVVYASHPAFVAPALKVTENWRYRAALEDGKPVATRWQETLYSDVITPGADPFSIPAKADPSLPSEYHYDLPPSIETAVQVVYPYDALMDGREGAADVVFVVDTDGRVRDITVRKASRNEFGQALAAAMAHWRFKPAMKDGAPAPAVLARGQIFNVDEEHLLLSPATRRLRDVLKNDKEQVVAYDRLDRPPQPIERTVPIYPAELSGKPGRAEIDFIIDREGRVQLPRIASATEPQFGWAAAAAVSLWRFEPPLLEGKPVDARARLPLEFTARPANEAPPAEAAAPEPADAEPAVAPADPPKS
jgi:TonB family protein